MQGAQPGGGAPGGPQQQPQPQPQPGGAPQQPGQGAPQQQQPGPYGQPYGYQAAAAAGYYGGAPGMSKGWISICPYEVNSVPAYYSYG